MSQKYEYVISGIAGRFPGCDNIDELADSLYDKRDLTTEDESRWPPGQFGLPRRSGKINHVYKFDAEYFDINDKNVNGMDVQIRILLELTFEALCDSGINPDEIRGHNIGVFVAADVSETEQILLNRVIGGPSCLTGTYRSLLANKISYCFDLNGPSYTLSTGCSGGAMALHQAIANIEYGQCDSAIVGGCHLNLSPLYALSFHKLGVTSPDGRTKFLSESANGYVRAEAGCVLYVQKLPDAKRIYARVVGIQANNDGFRRPPGRPATHNLAELMIRTMEHAHVTPDDIAYVECHGTGTYRGDQAEITAIDLAYCRARRERLRIGSIKTNLGHTETISALCQIAKAIIALECRLIPPSLIICDKYNETIKDIILDKLEPVVDSIAFTGGLIAVHSYGFGGTNIVTLLGDSGLHRNSNDYEQGVSHSGAILLPLFSRSEKGIVDQMEYFYYHPERLTNDLAKLFYGICHVSKMNYRGYLIMYQIDDSMQVDFKRHYSKVVDPRKSLLLIYPGLNRQGVNSMKSLLQFNRFKESVENSRNILNQLNIKLGEFDNLDQAQLPDVIIQQVVFQLALTDLFNTFNILGDSVLAFSIGKIACAYSQRLINHQDAITVLVTIVDFVKNKWPGLTMNNISEMMCKSINLILSEKIHMIFLSDYRIDQANYLNFTMIGSVDQDIVNYLSNLHWNCGLPDYNGMNELDINFDNYMVIEMSWSKIQNLSDKVTNINLYDSDSQYRGVLSCLGQLYQMNYPVDFRSLCDNNYPVAPGTQSISSLIRWDHSRDWHVVSWKDFI